MRLKWILFSGMLWKVLAFSTASQRKKEINGEVTNRIELAEKKSVSINEQWTLINEP